MRFMRILITLASKLSGREQECFGWIELYGKTLLVPRTRRFTQRHVRYAVATCGHLQDATSGEEDLFKYEHVLRISTSTLVLYLPNWKASSSQLHTLYLQPSLHACACVRAVHVNIFCNETEVYPPTHERKSFVQPKMLVIMDDPKIN